MPSSTKSAPRSRTTKASASTTLPSKTATGAIPASTAVAEVICPAAPRRNLNGTAAPAARPPHQTHGALTPLTGPVTNVGQLINGGRNIAKGSAATFGTLGDYTTHLRTLDLHGLRSHAISEKIIPIDDRERLIRRLEIQWTSTAARQPGRSTIPQRAPFTQEQIDAQEAIRNQLLRR